MSQLDNAIILQLTKARLGITSTVRDEYLGAIIKSVIAELEGEKGIALAPDDFNHVMFIVDYAVWRYQSVDYSAATYSGSAAMPRHLQFRLHNLVVHSGGDAG